MNELCYKEFYGQITNLKSIIVDNFSLGTSYLGQEITCFHIGKYNQPQILIEGAIHAREYITSLVILEECKLLKRLENSLEFGVFAVPLGNPDGVQLVLDGITPNIPQKLAKFLLKLNSSDNFKLWKANILGTDLNTNFNALWGNGLYNKLRPASENFIGYRPNSEKETRALIKLLDYKNIIGSLSFHSKGEVVYYGYDNLPNDLINRDKLIAEKLASFLRYTPQKTCKSVGGFSDLVSEVLKVPSFTIEVGEDTLAHPIATKQLKQILTQTLGVTQAFYNYIH